jgi:antitoxin ParD1/3/4
MRDWVQDRIDSGQYAGASDYVRDLIRRDQASVAERERQLAGLDAALEHAVADAEAGRLADASDVFDRLRAKYAATLAVRGER